MKENIHVTKREKEKRNECKSEWLDALLLAIQQVKVRVKEIEIVLWRDVVNPSELLQESCAIPCYGRVNVHHVSHDLAINRRRNMEHVSTDQVRQH